MVLAFILPAYFSLRSLAIINSLTTNELSLDVDKEFNDRVEKIAKESLESLNIENAVKFVEGEMTAAIGTNNPQHNNVLVTIESHFLNDISMCKWVIKHELCHILHDDCLNDTVVNLVLYVALTIFCALYPIGPFGIYSLLIGISVTKVLQTINHWYSEKAADHSANTAASLEELKGGIRYLKGSQKCNLEYAKLFPLASFVWNDKGDERLDFEHPTYSQRINMIIERMTENGLKYDPNDEQETKLTNIFVAKLIEKSIDSFSSEQQIRLLNKISPEIRQYCRS